MTWQWTRVFFPAASLRRRGQQQTRLMRLLVLRHCIVIENRKNWKKRITTRLPAIRSTTSVWVDCVTWAPLTLTITSFSLIPARWAAPLGRTVCTETGRSPDRVRPKPWSSRVTLSVLVLSAADGIGEDACVLLKKKLSKMQYIHVHKSQVTPLKNLVKIQLRSWEKYKS